MCVEKSLASRGLSWSPAGRIAHPDVGMSGRGTRACQDRARRGVELSPGRLTPDTQNRPTKQKNSTDRAPRRSGASSPASVSGSGGMPLSAI